MSKFIYVFNQQDKDTLLSQGYNLLKADDTRDVYIFETKDDLRFDDYDVSAVFSDILTF